MSHLCTQQTPVDFLGHNLYNFTAIETKFFLIIKPNDRSINGAVTS